MLLRTACGALLALSLPGTGLAQATPAPEDRGTVRIRGADVERYEEIAAKRRLVGREEGDNAFRDTTPALGRGSSKKGQVDIDRLYRRKRAMYDEGIEFRDFLPTSGVAEQKLATAAPVERRKKIPEPRTPLFKWVVLVLFLGTAVGTARVALGKRS